MQKAFGFSLILIMVSLLCCAKKSTINTPPVDNNPPEAPSNLEGTAYSASSILLTWLDNSDNEEYFAVFRRDAVTDTFAVCQRLLANSTDYTDTGLRDSSSYAYFVRAEKADTFSSSSNQIAVTTLPRGLSLVGIARFQAPDASLAILNGNYIIVAAGDGRLFPVDISVPAFPTLGQIFQAPGQVSAISAFVFVYLAMGHRGVQILQMIDPDHPVLLGNCDTPGFASDLRYVVSLPQGGYLYVVDGASLQIIDIDDLSNPIIAGDFHDPLLPQIYDVTVGLSFAYLACGDSGIAVLDITNITSPTLVSRLNIPGGAGKLSVKESSPWGQAFVYVINGTANMHIVNVTDRAHPVLGGVSHVGDGPRAINITENFGYIAYRDGVVIIDVSDPASPAYASFYPDTNEIGSIEIFGGYILLADNNGLRILQYLPQ